MTAPRKRLMMPRHVPARTSLTVVAALLVLLTTLSPPGPAMAQDQPHARLFPPDDIGILEAPDRDMWQRPNEIMDVLNIADGSVVADVGAAAGWFTVRLARRVGPNGLVFAEDIQQPMLDAIAYRVSHEGLDNVVNVLGTAEDPRLPADLDAVLIVDVYAEVEDPVSLLTNVAAALKPQGRLGIVDFTRDGGGPGPEMERRVEAKNVIRDAQAAGLSLLSHETFLTYQFLLVFGLEPATARQVQTTR
ncbi:MAG: methyltransferase domain-containing protein [Acidobacteriota bacterium]|nr:methyltransferase domain-containing protein [Acidobacteriota bacterium]